jgi:hypothetical protein
MFDNGKIQISMPDGIPLIEVYHNGELELADIAWVRHIVLNELSPVIKLPVDFIVDRKGNYSVSIGALVELDSLMQDAGRVAYVVHSTIQEQTVQMISSLYMSTKQVVSFNSVSEARAWLNGNAT